MTTDFPPALLNPCRRHAVRVSAALVSRRGDSLQAVFRTALDEAFTSPELVELVLQSLLFDGYPCALEGLLTLKDLLGSDYCPEEVYEPYDLADIAIWRKRGEALCRRIYGTSFGLLLHNVEGLSSTLKEWMLAEGYGRVLGRPSLPIDLRELGIIAILTVKDLPRQLHSHLRGALHVGVTASELEAALRLCAEFTTNERIESALRVWRKISSASHE